MPIVQPSDIGVGRKPTERATDKAGNRRQSGHTPPRRIFWTQVKITKPGRMIESAQGFSRILRSTLSFFPSFHFGKNNFSGLACFMLIFLHGYAENRREYLEGVEARQGASSARIVACWHL